MAAVALKEVSVGFGARTILDKVNFMVRTGDRIALTGPNGSGKTTLMRVMAGATKADSGAVELQKDTRVVYLPQEILGQGRGHHQGTVLEEMERPFAELHELANEMRAIEEQLGQDESQLDRYGQLADQIERSGYYQREERIDVVLRGLGFKDQDFSHPVAQLSGGWQMRVALAKVLLSRADIVLLDEPTNYLDLRARTWLEEYLSRFAGGVLLVAHDRAFLDTVSTQVADLQRCRIRQYRGGYSDFERTRQSEVQQETKAYEAQQEEIARVEAFIRKFRFNASKAKMVQSRIKYLDSLARVEPPPVPRAIRFRFPEPPRSGRRALRVSGIAKHYGANHVLQDVTFEVERGDRIGIVGDNGAGKSTLARLLATVEQPTAGTVEHGAGVQLGYLAQDGDVHLDERRTILEEVAAQAPREIAPRVRDLLGAFLFSGDDVNKRIGVLSGGERSRVAMVRLLLSPTNAVILDEPTNHLDIAATGVLAEALNQYRGTLLFVSHDRAFIKRLATKIIEVGNGGVRFYPGDFDYYVWKKAQGVAPDNQTASAKAPPRSASRSVGGSSRASKNEIARLAREEQTILDRLERLQVEGRSLETAMASAEVARDGSRMRGLSDQLTEVRNQEHQLNVTWEDVARQREQAGG